MYKLYWKSYATWYISRLFFHAKAYANLHGPWRSFISLRCIIQNTDYLFQNAQFSKPSQLRGMMPRKVNYSMHFACTHYNIGVIGLIIDGDFQVSIVIVTYKSHIIQDISNNFLIFIISFSFFLYRWFSLSSALFTQSSTSLYLPT